MKLVTLERDGVKVTVVLRQAPHDVPAEPGKLFKYGPGRRWTVVQVREAV